MKEEIQLPCYREAFFRRERRSIPQARDFTARALTDWNEYRRTYDVLLCVSELATNALRHGVPPGRGYRLHLVLGCGGLLLMEVHDSGTGMPRVRDGMAGAEDEGGRGLLLVSTLADKWGVIDRCPGKVVWCQMSLD